MATTQEKRQALRNSVTRYGTYEAIPTAVLAQHVIGGERGIPALNAAMIPCGGFDPCEWPVIDPFLKMPGEPDYPATVYAQPAAMSLTQPRIATMATSRPLTLAPGAPNPTDYLPVPETQNVSLLGTLARGAIGALPGGNLINTGINLVGQAFNKPKPQPQGVLRGGNGFSVPGAITGGMMGRPLGPAGMVVGGITGGLIGNLAGGATASGGCGCNRSNGRDPCTHQKIGRGGAMDATFFGGCCPPGYQLRRRPWARDVCVRIPRMNVYNPAALRRADRRVTGFARGAKKILSQMGYSVSARKPSLGKKRRRAGAARR